jgi:hypothetical protein
MHRLFFRYHLFAVVILFTFSTYAAADNNTGHDTGHKDHHFCNHHWKPKKLVPVPNGFQPEGAVKGPGHIAYVGSLKTGGIYKVNLASGKGELLVNKAAGPALGMAYDGRTHYLYVAGGPSGTVTVYDVNNGKQKAIYTLAKSGSFINDGIVTPKAVYFTDSSAPVIYSIPLKHHGLLADPNTVKTIQLTGDFQFIPNNFNGNGIETTKKGDKLYIVNTAAGELYRIDPNSGNTTRVTIDNGDVMNGDGMLRRGNKLYVVQNFLNQIAELTLSDDGLSATISNYITDSNFDVPTAVIGFGESLYALNARFDVAPPPFPPTQPADPSLHFELVRVKVSDD